MAKRSPYRSWAATVAAIRCRRARALLGEFAKVEIKFQRLSMAHALSGRWHLRSA
jgi:hypothetical protein